MFSDCLFFANHVCSNCCDLAQRRLQQVLMWLPGRNSAETGGQRFRNELPDPSAQLKWLPPNKEHSSHSTLRFEQTGVSSLPRRLAACQPHLAPSPFVLGHWSRMNSVRILLSGKHITIAEMHE